ncbi:DUF2949 domain-containing protein [Chroococcus sp. FPU101]|uniref:DUF2949 domain-containing protein n=1 Tax=Chroococcus sp. FPU101 TaxID=1974212 RepID=UPI001A8C18A3|nr:DUF2949 domain-containing protein [Chroococcus sp. FPU101]GFE70205.1 hypothetical protein CFPU101_28150 [Chroococcus sp. FPU101]
MLNTPYAKFLRFLHEDLDLSHESIAIAERSIKKQQGPLPMILWQYGLVTLEQLDRIYERFEEI